MQCLLCSALLCDLLFCFEKEIFSSILLIEELKK